MLSKIELTREERCTLKRVLKYMVVGKIDKDIEEHKELLCGCCGTRCSLQPITDSMQLTRDEVASILNKLGTDKQEEEQRKTISTDES